MNRRKFFSALGAGGAVAWLVPKTVLADQNTGSVYASPVPFIKDPSAANLTESDLSALFAVDPALSTQSQSSAYPQSVASGDPGPSGVVLWTRVAPQAQAGPSPNILAWQIAADPGFVSLLIGGIATLDSARDNTVKLPVQNAVLQPFSVYYYRFIYNGIASRTGRFKTLPAAGSTPAQLRLGYVVCQDYGHGYYNGLRYLAQEEVDYVVHLGDYIYETYAGAGFQNNAVRSFPPFPSGSTTVPLDVADYRHLYQVYRGDPDLQALHERFACIQLWDDHEFANDSHQDFHPDNNIPPNSPTTPQPALRQAANQAWAEYGLADVPFDPSKDWKSSLKLYRNFSFGTLADLVVTDERLYRDGPPCGNNELFGRSFSIGCPQLHNVSRTMLGAVQRQWFVNQITGSKAIWKLWANEVMLMQLKLAGAVFVNLDQWDGYPKERSAILGAIKKAGVQNLVALTGDLHTFLAGYLKTDFNNLFESPMGIELMVGSVTSANLAEGIEAAVPLPNCPVPAKQFGVPPNLLEPLIRVNNPHIHYWDSSTHGYGILDITPARLVCTFKAVTSIRAPSANLVTLKTITVPAGSTKLNIA